MSILTIFELAETIFESKQMMQSNIQNPVRIGQVGRGVFLAHVLEMPCLALFLFLALVSIMPSEAMAQASFERTFSRWGSDSEFPEGTDQTLPKLGEYIFSDIDFVEGAATPAPQPASITVHIAEEHKELTPGEIVEVEIEVTYDPNQFHTPDSSFEDVVGVSLPRRDFNGRDVGNGFVFFCDVYEGIGFPGIDFSTRRNRNIGFSSNTSFNTIDEHTEWILDGGGVQTARGTVFLLYLGDHAQFDVSLTFGGGAYFATTTVFWDRTGNGRIPNQDFILGDVNDDGEVNFADIPAFIAVLQSGFYHPAADINGDCVVNFTDIPLFIALLIAQ